MSNVVLHPALVAKFPWANIPNIDAPHPENKSPIRLGVSRPFIIGNLRKNVRTPIYQAWAHLAGKVPPVPNVEFLLQKGTLPSLTTLNDAYACFKGVSRPHGSEWDGASVYTYLIKVGVTVRFVHTPPVSVPATHKLDDDLSLAIYVTAGEGLQSLGESVWGTALRVELVETLPEDSSLPVDHESRYDERLW